MVNRLLAGQAEASQETNNGGQERDQEAVSETSQERRQGSDKTGQQASKETNDDPEESGDDVEDRVQERDDLGSEAEDGEERLDGEENLGDEDDNQVEDLVEVTVGNIETSRAEDLGEDVGELEVHVLELLGDVGLGVVLAEGTVLDLGEGAV